MTKEEHRERALIHGLCIDWCHEWAKACIAAVSLQMVFSLGVLIVLEPGWALVSMMCTVPAYLGQEALYRMADYHLERMREHTEAWKRG